MSAATELIRIATEEASYLKYRRGVPLDLDDLRQEAALAVLEAGLVDGPMARVVARRRLRNYCRYQRNHRFGMTFGFRGGGAFRGPMRPLRERRREDARPDSVPASLIEDPPSDLGTAVYQVLDRRAAETGYRFNPDATRQAREAYLKATIRWYAKNPRPFDV